jgi:predicted nucleic acid-binding protein
VSVLDAQAVVAAFIGEPAAGEVEELLRGGDGPPRISAANVAEVIDVLVRFRSQRSGTVEERLDWLIAGGLEVIGVDDGIARRAGALRARNYHARQRPISLADCLALATALALDDVLATSDPHLLDTAIAEGCRVRALPDSRGVKHTVASLPGGNSAA